MGLKDKAITSTKWNTTATVITVVIQVLQIAVLTRLLEKSDFGLIAIASLVLSFTDIFSELGITVALIHKQNISQQQYSSVYWMNIFTHVGICFLTIILAPLVASFYGEPILMTIVSLLSLKILFNAFGKMFQTIKVKNLDFAFISKVRILTCLIGFISTVLFAYYGFGVMSLVFGQLINTGFNQFVYAFVGFKKQKILFHFSYTEVKDFLNIGLYQFGAQMMDFIAARLDVLLIGKFFSMEELGIYNIAKELIIKPYTVINGLISNVLSSAFAKIQDNMVAVTRNFAQLIKLVTISNCFMYAIIFLFADMIVDILYSPSFAEVAVFLKILAFMGVMSAITSQGSVVMIALGRTDLGLRWTIVRILLSTIFLVSTAAWGVYSVAWGQFALSIVSPVVYFQIVLRPMMHISLVSYLQMFGKIVLTTIFIVISFVIIMTCITPQYPIQCLLAFGFTIIYTLYVRSFHTEIYNNILLRFIPIRIERW